MLATQSSSATSGPKHIGLGKGCELSLKQQRWPQGHLQSQGKLQALVMVDLGKLLG